MTQSKEARLAEIENLNNNRFTGNYGENNIEWLIAELKQAWEQNKKMRKTLEQLTLDQWCGDDVARKCLEELKEKE